MSFTIRTSCPYDNKYYIRQASGGWNGAVQGSPTKAGANVLANCFTGDTKIITREGIVALEDIVDKEVMALSLNGVYRKATGRYFGEQEIYELHLTNGAVYKTTPNHRWLVKSFAKNEALKEKTTEQLIVGDYIPYNKLEPLKINEDGIRHGFIYGDGGYYDDKKQSKANLCGYKKEYMKKYFENSAHNCESNGVESYYPYPKEYKKVADINETLDYLNGFLIGLIASDGCVDNKDGCVTISTTKKNDADEIKNICIVLGHRAKITKELRDTNYKENSLLYRVHIKKSTLSSEMFLNPQHKQNFGQPKEINYTRVTEIKKTGLYDSVFCIQEPETHTMTLEGGELTGQCVGYANGRFAEIMGKGYIPYQLVCNAENFIEKAKGYGLTISNTPTTGGIMVWMKGSTLSGSDGAGHVAVVERKNSDGSIYTSESGWGGPTFFNSTRNNSNGRWGQGSAYTFRGCIVNPSVNDEPAPTPSGDAAYIQQTLNQRYGFNLAVDNIAGPNTWKHLRMALQIEFNKQFGSNLVIDGIFGPATQSVMNRAIIAYGARGNITWLIQACLNLKGYKTGGIDGIWLNDTQTAVGNFQHNNGLEEDYKVGKNTYLKLFN